MSETISVEDVESIRDHLIEKLSRKLKRHSGVKLSCDILHSAISIEFYLQLTDGACTVTRLLPSLDYAEAVLGSDDFAYSVMYAMVTKFAMEKYLLPERGKAETTA